MSEDVGRNKDSGVALSERIEAELMGLHTATPARVVSYDATKQRAKVQVQLKREFENSDGTVKELRVAPILDVPILFPRAGGYSLTFPVAAGDPCLIVFLERDASGWQKTGQESVPPSARRHDYSDAVAILGLWPSTDPISPSASTTAASFRSEDNGKRVQISSTGVSVISDDLVSIQADSDVGITATGNVDVDAGGDQSLTAAGDITIDATGAVTVNGTAITIQAAAALLLQAVGALTLQPTGAFIVVSTGAITFTRGANELMDILSQALDKIGTSTVSGSPLSNAADIATLKGKIDTMRT